MELIKSIRKRAAELITEEILLNGSARVYNVEACIIKVKKELGVDLKENEAGHLIFSQ